MLVVKFGNPVMREKGITENLNNSKINRTLRRALPFKTGIFRALLRRMKHWIQGN